MSSGFSWSKVLGDPQDPEPAVAVKPVIEPDPDLGSDSAQVIAERLISEMAEPAPRPKAPEALAPEELPAPPEPADEAQGTDESEMPPDVMFDPAPPPAEPAPADLAQSAIPPEPAVTAVPEPEPFAPEILSQRQAVPSAPEPAMAPELSVPAQMPAAQAAPAPSAQAAPTPSKFAVGAGARNATEVGLDAILRMAMEKGASDIHFTVGLPPMIRHDGEIVELPFKPLSADDTQSLIYSAFEEEHKERFLQHHELDFAYSVAGLSRFRFNAYMQRGSAAAALRTIATNIPSFETLGLPPVIRELCKRNSGLILVTGPTGSGKSTTIASIIDDINANRTSHILTIEDPIEYLHNHKRCMVNQRELHADTFSFPAALRAVLREDPDIVLVGEMRDLETIEAALTLSETGHLVFGTLHTRNAPSTIDRVIDVFPPYQQDQIRVLLGNTLEAVVAQQLLPKLGGGRAAAIEVMLGTPAIKNLVREGKTHQMYSVIETSRNLGMQTMDSSLAEHYRSGACSYDECVMRSVDKESYARMAKGG